MIKFNDTEILHVFFGDTRLNQVMFNDQQLLPVDGLFDASGEQIAKWDELINYGMDCWSDYPQETYKTSNTSLYKILQDKGLTRGVKLVIPSTITDRSGNVKTTIGGQAFAGCSGLTYVQFGKNSRLESIGQCAFRGCESITQLILPFVGSDSDGVDSVSLGHIFGPLRQGYDDNISVPKSLRTVTVNGGKIGQWAFSNCSSLERITIADDVTSIGSSAFAYCSNLTSVYIGNTVGSIDIWIFRDCNNVTSITVGDNNTVYHSAGNCLIETATGTLITGCKTSIIPGDGSVTSIGQHAFQYCSSPTSISLPEGIIHIGDSAFADCSSLTSITIPNSVTSIGNDAFSGCSELASVTFAKGSMLESIGKRAFRRCSELNRMTLPFVGASKSKGETKTYFSYFFGSESYDYNGSKVPKSLTQVTIRGGSIAAKAFYNCPQQLKTVKLEEGVTSIGYWAFGYCGGLTSLTIPDTVKSIGGSAFRYCDDLKNINFNGTEAQWNAISKTGWNYEMLACTVTLSDGRKLSYEKNGRG